MPLPKQKKQEIQQRINRDPDFRDAFLVQARNRYKKALQFNENLASAINDFEQILGEEPSLTSDLANTRDVLDIFEKILDAYDSQLLEDEKNISTIN